MGFNDDELREIDRISKSLSSLGDMTLVDAISVFHRLRACHEAMRPVIRQLEQFATQDLAREAAPETCKAAMVVVKAWHAAEFSDPLDLGSTVRHSVSELLESIDGTVPSSERIESAIASLGSEHVESPDWQERVWERILDEKPSSK